jgi:3-oxoadipate enol-lactonase
MKIALNGIRLNYVERGLPDGLPVVFIHGFPFSHEMWSPQMSSLPNRYRAISYDIRGHGESDIGDPHYTIDLYVDDLLALMDHLVINKAVLCGLSMGGYIALRAVERAPERIRGLILCDTRSEADTDEAKIRRSDTLRLIQSSGVHVFVQEFIKSLFAPRTFTQRHEAVELIKRIIGTNQPTAICGALLALAARTDTTSTLHSISVPALLLVGEYDQLTPPSATKAMHDRIPGSRMHIIPEAGHISNLENPEAFNTLIESFLLELGGST